MGSMPRSEEDVASIMRGHLMPQGPASEVCAPADGPRLVTTPDGRQVQLSGRAAAQSPAIVDDAENPLVRHHRDPFLRGVAAAGGVPVPPASVNRATAEAGAAAGAQGETRPLLGQGRRRAQAQVQQRLLTELWMTFQCFISIMLTLIGITLIVLPCLFLWVIYAIVYYSDQPCDEPLKYYLLVFFSVGLVNQAVKAVIAERCSNHVKTAVGVLGAAATVTVNLWGLRMILSAETCADTNPELFYPTKYLIYVQTTVWLLLSVFFVVGFRIVLINVGLSALEKPGCENAVREMPKVPSDSPELLDPEDGRIMDCPICAETMSSAITVKTPCTHYFHEDCLAKWCKNHTDCPLCRAKLGDEDVMSEAGVEPPV